LAGVSLLQLLPSLRTGSELKTTEVFERSVRRFKFDVKSQQFKEYKLRMPKRQE
jgi:hypothetical protein